MYDTVKGSDWLGDQDAIHYMCREAPRAVSTAVLPLFIFCLLLLGFFWRFVVRYLLLLLATLFHLWR